MLLEQAVSTQGHHGGGHLLGAVLTDRLRELQPGTILDVTQTGHDTTTKPARGALEGHCCGA